MKKLLTTLLAAAAVLGGTQVAFADKTINDSNKADITVKGTLGADNTDLETTIPEGDKDWINVTLPTETIFYNKIDSSDIQAPKYDITNNSGRPVKISVINFVDAVQNPTLPTDFNLTLNVTKGLQPTAKTTFISGGTLQTPTNALFTLANKDGHISASDPSVNGSNKGTFTYGGSATAKTPIKVKYTLGLKFDSIEW